MTENLPAGAPARHPHAAARRPVVAAGRCSASRRLTLPAFVEAAGGYAPASPTRSSSPASTHPTPPVPSGNALNRFLTHADGLGLELHPITPKAVSAYLKNLQAEVRGKCGEPSRFQEASKPRKKLDLAAIRHFFDKAVERHAVMLNPALSVRGPKLSVREGKTKGLGVKQASGPACPGCLRTRTALQVVPFVPFARPLTEGCSSWATSRASRTPPAPPRASFHARSRAPR